MKLSGVPMRFCRGLFFCVCVFVFLVFFLMVKPEMKFGPRCVFACSDSACVCGKQTLQNTEKICSCYKTCVRIGILKERQMFPQKQNKWFAGLSGLGPLAVLQGQYTSELL